MSNLRIAFCVTYWFQKTLVKKFNKSNFNKDIKANMDIINQIFQLWKSIKINITSVDYDFYVFTKARYVTNEIKNIFTKHGIKLILLNTQLNSHFRPMMYTHPLDCDYRIILDCDILFLNDFTPQDIVHFKKHDVMGMYGHRNIGYNRYKEILDKLSLKIPAEITQTKHYSNAMNWTTLSTYKYNLQKNNINQRLFPYFNNGMIMIKNDVSKAFGALWVQKREQLTNLKLYNINCGQAGELTIGLCINHITNNWGPLPKGYNLVCSHLTTTTYSNLYLEENYNVKPICIHYQYINTTMKIYKKYIHDIIFNNVYGSNVWNK